MKKNLVLTVLSVSLTALCVRSIISFSANPHDELSICKSNIEQLWQRTIEWSNEHQGRFPSKLKSVTVKVPNCPSAKFDTYSVGYESINQRGADGLTISNFTIMCSGVHHSAAGVGPNCPFLSTHNTGQTRY